MTERDLLAHLERMPVQHEVGLQDLLLEVPVTCVDGRKKECIVGAPGGNAGLFVLLLAALEEVGGETLDEAEVQSLFEAYLDRFGHFYMHTDEHALRGVSAHDDVPAGNEAAGFVRRPPEDARATLSTLLDEPRFMGCGHLRLIAQHPDQYEVRPVLLKAFMRAFFEALWSGDARVIYDVLPGDHGERAVVSVVADDVAEDNVVVPAICPHHGDTQVFVAHPQAISYLLKEQAAFAEEQGYVDAGERARLVEAQEALSARQLAATLEHLAEGLPRFQVNARSGSMVVTAA